MQVFHEEKLAELIVFFTKHSQDDRLFGSTKLNKLLWAADFLAYGYMGQSITGARYIHQERGPTPAPEQFMPVRDSLIRSGRLRIEEEETYRGTMRRPVTDSDPDETLFEDGELDLCRDLLEDFGRMSNREVSKWSHDFPGWRYSRLGEEIPYQAVYLWEKEPVTKDDIEWGLRVAGELGFI